MAEIRPNTLLQGLTVPHARKGVYRPEVGHTITVSLTGEKVRAEIEEVVSNNAVLAVITGVTFRQGNAGPAKGHKIPVIRDEDDMGVEVWRIVEARELQQSAEEEQFRQQELRRASEAAPAAVAPVAPDGVALPSMAHPGNPPISQYTQADVEAGNVLAPEHRRVLGPRRSKVAKPAPADVPANKLGQRRSRVARAG